MTNEAATQAQYEALGRFVGAFEKMVANTRWACSVLLTQDSARQQRLLSLFLNHHVMTAPPLFEIFRAICHTQLQTDGVRGVTSGATVKAVLKQLSTEHEKLVSARNFLLHGTWVSVGSREADDTVNVFKFKVTADGLVSKVLGNRKELVALTERCREAAALIAGVHFAFVPFHPAYEREQLFQKVDGKWVAASSIQR